MSEEYRKPQNSEEAGNKKGSRNKRNFRYKIDPTNMTIGDFNIQINGDSSCTDAIKLLEQMYLLRSNDTLTSQERADRLKKILEND